MALVTTIQPKAGCDHVGSSGLVLPSYWSGFGGSGSRDLCWESPRPPPSTGNVGRSSPRPPSPTGAGTDGRRMRPAGTQTLDEIVPSRIREQQQEQGRNAPPRTSRPDGMNEKRKWHHLLLSRVASAETLVLYVSTHLRRDAHKKHRYDATLLSSKSCSSPIFQNVNSGRTCRWQRSL
jgi:hypothetical protein